MRLLVTGASGQLGQEVASIASADTELILVTRAELDLERPDTVADFVRQSNPTHILHGAAWTAVDAAEAEVGRAEAVNVASTRAFAEVSRELGAKMLYVSTDFVFGDGHDRPIAPDAPTDPLNEYGRTKRDGERALIEVLGEDALIVRTSWVYSDHGANFVKTMLRLMNERDSLNVVADQIGAPTFVNTLATAALRLLVAHETGIWHVSDAGTASWYDFAIAIYEEGRARGLIQREVRISPIPAALYPTPARRPHFSVMDRTHTWNSGIVEPIHWRVRLREMLDRLV